jgi:hypothetical protein
LYKYAPASKEQTQSQSSVSHSYATRKTRVYKQLRQIPPALLTLSSYSRDSDLLVSPRCSTSLPRRWCQAGYQNCSQRRRKSTPARSFTQRALRAYRTGCVTSWLLILLAKKKKEYPACSLAQRHKTVVLVREYHEHIDGPFQGQLLPCVCPCYDDRNSGVSARVS